MLRRMMSRCTRSADFVAASRRNFCAASSPRWSCPTMFRVGAGALVATPPLFAGSTRRVGVLVLINELAEFRRPRSYLSVSSVVRFSARQNTRQMYRLRLHSILAQDALHVHQAAWV